MRKALSRAVDGVAIVVTLATIGLWVRSYYACDRFGWSVGPGRSSNFEFVVSRAIETTPGRIVLRDYTGFM